MAWRSRIDGFFGRVFNGEGRETPYLRLVLCTEIPERRKASSIVGTWPVTSQNDVTRGRLQWANKCKSHQHYGLITHFHLHVVRASCLAYFDVRANSKKCVSMQKSNVEKASTWLNDKCMIVGTAYRLTKPWTNLQNPRNCQNLSES